MLIDSTLFNVSKVFDEYNEYDEANSHLLLDIVFKRNSPEGEWATSSNTAMPEQPVRCEEQALTPSLSTKI